MGTGVPSSLTSPAHLHIQVFLLFTYYLILAVLSTLFVVNIKDANLCDGNDFCRSFDELICHYFESIVK